MRNLYHGADDVKPSKKTPTTSTTAVRRASAESKVTIMSKQPLVVRSSRPVVWAQFHGSAYHQILHSRFPAYRTCKHRISALDLYCKVE